MTQIVRHIDKFESADGLLSYIPSLVDYEWETSQALRNAFAEVSGAHYAIDLRGSGTGVKSLAQERLRFVIYERCGPRGIEASIDEIRAVLFRIGRGKLWTRDSDDTRRWAWARINEIPSYTINFEPENVKILPVTVEFTRLSDWRSKDLVTGSQSASGTVIINNPGTARVYDVVLTLRGTYTTPTITNTTNNYSIQTARSGTSNNHRVKFDAGLHTVEYSSNAGSSWANDYSSYFRPQSQVQIMVLEPGDNAFTFSGMTSATLEWSFYGAWH